MLRRLRNTAIKTTTTSLMVVAAVELTTELPSMGRSSNFYHKCADYGTYILRSVLDAEDAHNAAIRFTKSNLAPRFRPTSLEKYTVNTSSSIIYKHPSRKENLELKFPSCVGLAAGFDKNGEAIQGLLDMGFGFVEIGSITPEAQYGNPKKRLFRLTEDRGVINRYGFNSDGAAKVEANITDYYKALDQYKDKDTPTSREGFANSVAVISNMFWNSVGAIVTRQMVLSQRGLLGVNLGKNKYRVSEVETIEDYTSGIMGLGPYADYIVINISSPNTPGLRGMQKLEPLKKLLTAAMRARDSLIESQSKFDSCTLPPVFVKIAPDLTMEELEDIAQVVQECNVDGIVVCNTTNSRPGSLQSKYKNEAGGLSGAPLRELSTDCIRKVYRMTEGKIPIIGVGGVGSGQDVYEKLRAGASLVELYSMMTFGGPGVVARIRKELVEIMKQNGHRSIDEIVGVDHDELFWKKREEKRRSQRKIEKVIVDL